MSKVLRRSSGVAHALGVALLPLLAACFGAASAEYLPLDDCPVTTPTGGAPPSQQPAASYHHEGEFWVSLTTSGVFNVDGPEDGAKVIWWRPTDATDLEITGRRLDGPSEPLVADILSGYAYRLQATGLEFAEPGCWEVTAQSAGHELTFVTRVAFEDR